jgi:hypothetical protein
VKIPTPKKAEEKTKSQEKINPKGMIKDYLTRIEDELEIQGAVFFDEDKLNIDPENLVLPREITEVPSKSLGEYLNAFTQQKMYLRTLLGRTSLVLEEKKRAYINMSKDVYRKYSIESTKLSETAKDRLINSNETVVPYYHDFSDYQKKYEILELSILSIEEAIFMLSREVTRRTGEFNDENRNYNVQKVRR